MGNTSQTPSNIREVSENNSVEMRIPARAEWVRVVRLATAGVAARLGFSYDDVEDLKLAVAEACNNAILHGSAMEVAESQSTPLPQVTVRWTIFPDRLRISISDEGRLELDGLPMQSKPDPTAQTEDVSEELPEGGMGLLLIQTLMDEVEQESGPHADTTLHMVKYAPPARLLEPRRIARHDKTQQVSNAPANRDGASATPKEKLPSDSRSGNVEPKHVEF